MKKIKKLSKWSAAIASVVLLLLVFGCENKAPFTPIESVHQQVSDDATAPPFRIIRWGKGFASFNKKHKKSRHIKKTEGGEIQLSSDVNIITWPYGIFSNKKIKFDKGSGSISADIYGKQKVKIEYNKYSVNGTVSEGSPVVAAPTVDWNFYQNLAIADGQYVHGKKTFDAAGSPYSGIWYVTDDVEIKQNVVINGSIVTERHVVFEGTNIVLSATPEIYPALIANEDIKIKKDQVEINGFFYGGKHVVIESDDVKICGALVSLEDFESKGDNFSFNVDSTYFIRLEGIDFGSNYERHEAVFVDFKVLPNSMPQSNDIEVTMDDEQLSGGVDLEFQPHGTTFNPPALLNIIAQGIDLSGVNPATVDIFYVNENTGQWEPMPKDDLIIDVNSGTIKVVNARLPHFSRYAIGDTP